MPFRKLGRKVRGISRSSDSCHRGADLIRHKEPSHHPHTKHHPPHQKTGAGNGWEKCQDAVVGRSVSRVQVTPIPILSKPRLVKLAICGHCGQYSCRVGWVRIRNTGAQCVIWVYGLFWIVYVMLLGINVGLILLYLSLIKIPFCLIFVSGTFL